MQPARGAGETVHAAAWNSPALARERSALFNHLSGVVIEQVIDMADVVRGQLPRLPKRQGASHKFRRCQTTSAAHEDCRAHNHAGAIDSDPPRSRESPYWTTLDELLMVSGPTTGEALTRRDDKVESVEDVALGRGSSRTGAIPFGDPLQFHAGDRCFGGRLSRDCSQIVRREMTAMIEMLNNSCVEKLQSGVGFVDAFHISNQST